MTATSILRFTAACIVRLLACLPSCLAAACLLARGNAMLGNNCEQGLPKLKQQPGDAAANPVGANSRATVAGRTSLSSDEIDQTINISQPMLFQPESPSEAASLPRGVVVGIFVHLRCRLEREPPV